MTTLTFGDTFTLPITGDDVWTIRDLRAHSYQPPENLTLPGRALVAQATCARYEPGWGPRPHNVVQYEVGLGWVFYGPMTAEREAVLAELRELDVHMEHRTDDEWRAIHFADLREELAQALGTTMLGGPNRMVTPHPLVSDEETIAFAVATVAEIASKRPGAALFDPIYWATLERLRA